MTTSAELLFEGSRKATHSHSSPGVHLGVLAPSSQDLGTLLRGVNSDLAFGIGKILVLFFGG